MIYVFKNLQKPLSIFLIFTIIGTLILPGLVYANSSHDLNFYAFADHNLNINPKNPGDVKKDALAYWSGFKTREECEKERVYLVANDTGYETLLGVGIGATLGGLGGVFLSPANSSDSLSESANFNWTPQVAMLVGGVSGYFISQWLYPSKIPTCDCLPTTEELYQKEKAAHPNDFENPKTVSGPRFTSYKDCLNTRQNIIFGGTMLGLIGGMLLGGAIGYYASPKSAPDEYNFTPLITALLGGTIGEFLGGWWASTYAPDCSKPPAEFTGGSEPAQQNQANVSPNKQPSLELGKEYHTREECQWMREKNAYDLGPYFAIGLGLSYGIYAVMGKNHQDASSGLVAFVLGGLWAITFKTYLNPSSYPDCRPYPSAKDLKK